MMNPVSPLPIVAALAVAIATALLLGKIFQASRQPPRIISIDGLGGYLALLAVVLCSLVAPLLNSGLVEPAIATVTGNRAAARGLVRGEHIPGCPQIRVRPDF